MFGSLSLLEHQQPAEGDVPAASPSAARKAASRGGG
jgi:hypothetical protein